MNFSFEISIIIPTLNEEIYLNRLLSRLKDDSSGIEIWVVDGGSTDNTVEIARQKGVRIIETSQGRAHQLNEGAKAASNDLLYFVHADTLPPENWRTQIEQAYKDGYRAGCFRFEFEENKGMMKLNSYCTRFPLMIFRGGDQSLFVSRELFVQVDGFDENLAIMEDYNIIKKLRRHTRFVIMSPAIIVSSRKYKKNNYMRVNLANFVVFTGFYCGFNTQKLKSLYGLLLNYP